MSSVPTAVNPSTQYLYRLRDADGVLLYVGVTNDWPSRFKQHQRDKAWFNQVVFTEAVPVGGNRAQLEAIEKAVIVAEKPLHNITHNTEARRLTLPKAEQRVELWWREEDDGSTTHFHKGDKVFTFGMVGTLLDVKGEELDYLVAFDCGEQFWVDGTCNIRHALPDDKDIDFSFIEDESSW